MLTDSGWEPEALRIVFEVRESAVPSQYWFATIVCYNVDNTNLLNDLADAEWITLEAGYQTGKNKSTIIWDSPVLQVTFDRPHVVDTTVTFNCVATLPLLEQNFVNMTVRGTQFTAVSRMISPQGGDIQKQLSALAQEKLANKSYPRTKTFFGVAGRYIGEISDDNFITHWINKDQPYMSEIYNPDGKATPAITYGPPYPPGFVTSFTGGPTDAKDITRSIVGTPRQTSMASTSKYCSIHGCT